MSWKDREVKKMVNEAFSSGYDVGWSDAICGAYRVSHDRMDFETFETEVTKEVQRERDEQR